MGILMGLLFIFIVVLLFKSIIWFTHLTMTKDESNCKEFGWANYKQFIKEFEKRKNDWEVIRYGNEASFRISETPYNSRAKSYVWASIIYFDYIGMLMRTPYDWFMVERYLNKYNNRDDKKQYSYKW